MQGIYHGSPFFNALDYISVKERSSDFPCKLLTKMWSDNFLTVRNQKHFNYEGIIEEVILEGRLVQLRKESAPHSTTHITGISIYGAQIESTLTRSRKGYTKSLFFVFYCFLTPHKVEICLSQSYNFIIPEESDNIDLCKVDCNSNIRAMV